MTDRPSSIVTPTLPAAAASAASGFVPAAPEHCFVPYPAPPGGTPHAPSGPLAGLRFVVKDIYDVAGYPTGCGSPHLLALSGVKTVSAPVVRLLLDAGAGFAGKVVTDELAFSMNGNNRHFGAPRNGAAPDRITGGSSSGSASAVSCGLADTALGSDTGGSVRAPASHCGLIGLRPTQDRIPLDGCMPLAPGFDTCGWFARDMDTFARVGRVLLGPDTAPVGDRPRWMVAADVLEMLDAPVRQAFAETLRGLAPVLDGAPTPVRAACGLSFDTLYWAFRHLQGRESWRSHGETIRRFGLQLGPGVRERFEWSSGIAGGDLSAHEAAQADFRESFAALIGDDGVLLLPTMPGVAPRLAEPESALDDYRNRAIRMLCLAGLSGFPQISLPMMSIDGVPLGLSLIGAPGSDSALIALSARLLASTPSSTGA